MTKINHVTAAMGVLALAGLASSGQADSASDFFRGKTIAILVGAGVGGGYDLNTRIFAAHFGNHIPGNPKIVVQNMPGAGGLVLANFLYNVAPKDGTSLGVFAASVALEPVFGDTRANYDPSRFEWIGSLEKDTPSCGVWKGAGQGIKTLDDVLAAKKTLLFGSTSPAATTSQHALLLENYLGAPIKVIYGYQGTSQVKLALEKGELTGTCGLLESSVKSTFSKEYADGDLNIFVQFGTAGPVPFFGSATWIYDKAKNAEDRQMLDVIFKQAELARPFAAPPGVPADRVALLRKAMLATMQDPALIAAAARIRVQFHPASGEETEKIFASYYQIPKPLIERALSLIGQK